VRFVSIYIEEKTVVIIKRCIHYYEGYNEKICNKKKYLL